MKDREIIPRFPTNAGWLTTSQACAISRPASYLSQAWFFRHRGCRNLSQDFFRDFRPSAVLKSVQEHRESISGISNYQSISGTCLAMMMISSISIWIAWNGIAHLIHRVELWRLHTLLHTFPISPNIFPIKMSSERPKSDLWNRIQSLNGSDLAARFLDPLGCYHPRLSKIWSKYKLLI